MAQHREGRAADEVTAHTEGPVRSPIGSEPVPGKSVRRADAIRRSPLHVEQTLPDPAGIRKRKISLPEAQLEFQRPWPR